MISMVCEKFKSLRSIKNVNSFFVHHLGIIMIATWTIFFILLFYDLRSPPSMATVDIHQILKNYIVEESQQKNSPEQIRQNLKRFSVTFENILAKTAQSKQVVLLPKRAVLAGAVDYTTIVQKTLNKVVDSGK